jgi:hypothetical protein
VREDARIDVERLLAEIERYLRAVDAFRDEGCDITWARTPSVPATSLHCP